MDKTRLIKDLERHIKALKVSYENLIEILNQPLERNENEDEGENGKIKLKDSQKKVFAQGVMETATAVDDLFQKIKTKEAELEEIKNPKISKKKKKDENESDLNSRLK